MNRRALALALAVVVLLSAVAGTATGNGHGVGAAPGDGPGTAPGNGPGDGPEAGPGDRPDDGPGAGGPPVGVGPDDMTRVIVVFTDHAARSAAPIEAAGGWVTGGEDVDLVPVAFAMVPGRAVRGLERNPNVAGVYPDAIATVDPAAATQTTPWGIDRIEAQAAATAGLDATDQSNVQVAVIDTGIDYDHEDLQNNVDWGVRVTSGQECWWIFCWPTEELSYGKQAANDDNGHGTHVAGTVAAEDNGLGVVGVAPHVSLYSVKVLDSSGSAPYSVIITGMDEAVKGPDGVIGTADDADVLSMSLSGPSEGGLCDAVNSATAAGSVVVAAAGNSGDGDTSSDDVRYPAKCAGAIAVAATNSNDGTPTWSAEGPDLDVAAPGVSVYSTARGNGYTTMSGTSMATPHVSGTVALLLAQDLQDGTRDLSPDDVRTRLVQSTDDLGAPGFDYDTGYGLVMVDQVLGVGDQEPTAIGETGRVTVSQSSRDQWHTVSLSNTYANPVVVMEPPSYNGDHALHVRVRNVGPSSFEFRLEEWLIADGSHTTETVSYMVVEAGSHTLADGRTLEAGTVEVDEADDFVAFGTQFSSTPVVLSQVQTVVEDDPVVTRMKSVSTGGFTVRLQEEEARGGHATETVGYVAIAKGDGQLDGTAVQVASTPNKVTHRWYRIDFGAQNFGTAPVFLAAQQTTDGGDPAGLRYQTLDGSGVEVKVEEEKSSDTEVNHTSEVVGYVVFGQSGTLYGY
ncbi:S8 family serine peptidase [Haloarchaeobius sp. DYHT-AS-18]|uniref:S8 family serine peptidase n=1 Tax=Haloarchaeobius sp. DYHT-AS-18 TaxID=3446117 RepID=UPI003EBC81C0